MFDPQRADLQVIKALGEMRLDGRLGEVERNRLLRDAGIVGPRRRDWVLAGIGRLLVAAGERLQRRYEPARNGLPASRSPAEGGFS